MYVLNHYGALLYYCKLAISYQRNLFRSERSLFSFICSKDFQVWGTFVYLWRLKKTLFNCGIILLCLFCNFYHYKILIFFPFSSVSKNFRPDIWLIMRTSVLMLGLEQGHLIYLSFQPHQTYSNYGEQLSSLARVLL